MRSASATSSSVDRNASTSWCGRCRTKPDGVGQGEPAAGRRPGPAHRRVQGGEQRVIDQDSGPGQPVEQAGLARVGVARDGHRRHLAAAPLPALDLPAHRHLGDLAAQLGDARPDPAPVSLDLGFTGPAGADAAAAGHPAAGLPGQRLTPAAQPRQQVLQLRQLDLRLALLAAGVLGEDVQDQRGAVDDLHLHHALQRRSWLGGELAVADDGVGAGRRRPGPASSAALPAPT